MSKCIVCECSMVLKYEPPKERPPLKCPNCGRDTRHYPTMKTDDPRVKLLVDQYRKRFDSDPVKSGYSYCIKSMDGKVCISIPAEGCVIGRTASGGEQLAHNGRISREHVKMIPAKRAQGVMITDLSANGTFVDGRRIPKNDPEFIVIGSVIKMGGEEFLLEKENGDE